MTQRYKITTQITPTLSGGYDTAAIAVPNDQGDFVLYDAVSHLAKEKTIEQHRAEFEEWARSHYFLCELTLHRDGEDYSDSDIGLAWESWKAAKGIEE